MLKTFLFVNKFDQKELKSFCFNKAISGYCFDDTHEPGLINIFRDSCDPAKQFMVILKGVKAKDRLLELRLNSDDIVIINREDIDDSLFYSTANLISQQNLKLGIALGQLSPIENIINVAVKTDYILLMINHISKEYGSEKLLGLSKFKNGNNLNFIIGVKTDLTAIDESISEAIESQGAQDIVLMAN